MDRAIADHLLVANHEDEWPDVPAQREPGLSQVGELTQKASWHIASLARVIDQLEEATNVARPHGGAIDVGVESQLTQREQQVLGLLVQGLSNRKIARTLCISESTVKNHLHAIFLKMDVTDRTQAIAAILGGKHRHRS
jgi:DNA-binding NarL/FixJ family response regulator